jgi:hypothetical protein
MYPSHSLRTCLLVAVSLLFLTCTTAEAAVTRIEAKRMAGGHAVLSFAEAPLRTMKETPFAIQLFDADGKPAEEAAVKLSLTMPAMPMPPNNPAAAWSDGAYRGTAIFTMAGAWQVHATIERTGSAPETITFDIEMVIMQ